jgi:hypothetical protein
LNYPWFRDFLCQVSYNVSKRNANSAIEHGFREAIQHQFTNFFIVLPDPPEKMSEAHHPGRIIDFPYAESKLFQENLEIVPGKKGDEVEHSHPILSLQFMSYCLPWINS